MSKKDSFILHDDQYECFSLLTMAQRGQLITAIFEYRLKGETTQSLSENVYMAYHLITSQIRRDTEKYEKLCEKRRQAIETRYKQANTNEYKCSNSNQMNTNATYTDTVTNTVTDTVTDTVKEESIKEEKRKRFLPPSLEEVKKYCSERGNYVNAEQFTDFYTAKGWKVGSNPMKDWKAAVRTWERRDKQDNGKAEQTQPQKKRYGDFDTDDAFQKALERTYRKEGGL